MAELPEKMVVEERVLKNLIIIARRATNDNICPINLPYIEEAEAILGETVDPHDSLQLKPTE